MKKSLIAAAFAVAVALPVSAMTQDIEIQQQAPETPDEICAQISATEHFCIAIQGGEALVVEIETPYGILLGAPGTKYDDKGNAEECLGIVDYGFNLLDVICQGDVQQPAQPKSGPTFQM